MRIRSGDTMEDLIPVLRTAADKAAQKLIDIVADPSTDSSNDFESWLINRPEYTAFIEICDRLNEAVNETEES